MDKIVGSLIGVVVGFLLSQFAGFVKGTAAKRRERNSIRRLLSLELNQNLSQLEDYWHDVSLSPDEDEPKENQTLRLVRRSQEIPYPSFVSIVWQSHISRLAEFLNEEELKEVWRQYEIIRFLPSLHEKLGSATTCKTEREYGYSRASRALRVQGINSATFKSESAALMMEFKILIEESLKIGNPLK